jgi:hypothetical protein
MLTALSFVMVKRPDYAEFLAQKAPHVSRDTKNTKKLFLLPLLVQSIVSMRFMLRVNKRCYTVQL